MVRRRRFKDGTRPPRARWKQTQLRNLIPRVGFELDHPQYRRILTGLDSWNLKDAIRAHYGTLKKAYFEEALTMAFRQANATLDSGFYNKIAELGISNFWDTIMKTIPWYNDNCTDPIKNVTEWLVTSHERYNKVHPYERMKHQYGMFATEVHKFSESLKRLHGDNQHIMECYFKCDKWDSEPEEAEDEDLADAMAGVGLKEAQTIQYYGNGGKHKDSGGSYDAYSGEYLCYRDDHDIYIRVDEDEEEEEEEYRLAEAVEDMELDD